MIPLAHFGGLPVEEVLLPLAYGGTGVWAAFWIRFLVRAPRRRRRAASVTPAGSHEVGTTPDRGEGLR